MAAIAAPLTLPTGETSPRYKAIVDEALLECEKIEALSRSLETYSDKIKKWKEDYQNFDALSDEKKADAKRKCDTDESPLIQYCHLRNRREEIRRIRAVVFEALTCLYEAPPADPSTLGLFVGIGANMETLKRKYDEIFVTHRAQLKKHIKTLDPLVHLFQRKTDEAKEILEPLAHYCDWGNGTSFFSRILNRTTYPAMLAFTKQFYPQLYPEE